ncbi:hypothetical protein LCGC14_1963340 [marine sediment metagenome]|uniref:Uncharacterized protein n=1 Tax=marine sediment metagenome TaxID=412755 RepID=A0A0F9IAZ0_9ZZZZ
MKETGILMSAPMVKAILEDRKTCTRRIMLPQPHIEQGILRWDKWKNTKSFVSINMTDHPDLAIPYCPYGQVGDRLWVRETFRINIIGGVSYKADENESWIGKWKPSIFMPKKFARLWLEITGVRAEHLQDIDSWDCIHEGILQKYYSRFHNMFIDKPNSQLISEFHVPWDSINAKRGYGWDTNPFVWPIDYKRVK